MKVYKVVEARTRYGSNVMGHKMECGFFSDPPSAQNNFRKLIRKYPDIFPKYTKGKIVTALPDTAGIFCFESKYFAERFTEEYYLEGRCKIIRVEGIGDPIKPKWVLSGGFDLDKLLAYLDLGYLPDRADPFYKGPVGCINFASVRVLE
jgi:hypothetical protein